MTQEKLAEKTGLSAQTINDIEGCRTWVSDKTLVRLADALQTNPAELLRQHPDNSSPAPDIFQLKHEIQDSVRKAIEQTFTRIEI